MSGILKHTTGLTGLNVSKNPRQSLKIIYGKILQTLQKLPTEYPYRRHTEKIIQERAEIVNNVEEVNQIEEKIGCGQVEELILQANKELKLVRNMLQWRSWEQNANIYTINQWAWPPQV